MIEQIREIAYGILEEDSHPAHGKDHIIRVENYSQEIKKGIILDDNILIPSILLHDIGRKKAFEKKLNHAELSAKMAEDILKRVNFPANKIPLVQQCIIDHSYMNETRPQSIEGIVLWDADKLDALGAIGLYRTFVYNLGRKLYNPEDPFCINRKPNQNVYTLDHIFEKILKLENLFYTDKAKELAKKRTEFIQYFLQELALELNGEI